MEVRHAAHPASASNRLRFGTYEIDLRAGLLSRRGEPVRIQDKPFRILARLVERAGQVVTRDELRSMLWPDGVHVDFEHGLNAAMGKLRTALRDNAADARFIETIPRRGYRFVAPVAPAARTADGPERITLAVLPLANVSRDPEPFFAEGLTDELISRLGGLSPRRLGVIARTSVMRFRGGTGDVQAVGHGLGAGVVLEGSVRRDGERVRVSLRLVDVADRSVMWSEAYERTLTDLFAVQHEIADSVARALRLELLPRGDTPRDGKRRVDAEAHEAYLRGCYAMSQRTPAGFASAIENLKTATAISDDLAEAHAALAECHGLAPDYGIAAPRDAFPRSREAALRAIELDPDLPRAHVALAYVHHRFDWNRERAEARYDRAIELNPSSAVALHRRAEFLSQLGRHDEAIAAISNARTVDPLSPIIKTVEAWILYHARRYDGAEACCRHVLADDPHFSIARFVLGRALLQLGRPTDAVRESERAVEHATGNPFVLAGHGVTSARAGSPACAEEILTALEHAGRERHVSPWFAAKVLAALGRIDEAFAALDRAHAERSGWMTDLRVDPELDDLRVDPRFDRLLRQVGFGEG